MYGNFVHATNDASHYTTPPTTAVETVHRDIAILISDIIIYRPTAIKTARVSVTEVAWLTGSGRRMLSTEKQT